MVVGGHAARQQLSVLMSIVIVSIASSGRNSRKTLLIGCQSTAHCSLVFSTFIFFVRNCYFGEFWELQASYQPLIA